ncbi:MAG: hypothetical protein LBS10_03125 [Gracilibacteraceae bacterium]|jgi:hypothetical protein|nr:hypothetical protein [Gracilibacteraceae bacterium]
MRKKKTSGLRGRALTAGAALVFTALICLKPSRAILFTLVKSAALLHDQSRRSITGKLSGDWRGKTVDIYYGFDHGILYVTDRRGFAGGDWQTGTYELYRNTNDPADGCTMVMHFAGQSTAYAFAAADAETIVFTRDGEDFPFESIRY